MAKKVNSVDGEVDEIFAEGVNIHIEQMDDGVWWIGIGHPDGTVDHLNLYTARGAKIIAKFDENV